MRCDIWEQCFFVVSERKKHLVPEVEGAVGSRGGEGAERRVEGDRVDSIYLGVLAVAFEGKVLTLVRLVHVVHRHSALDRAEAEAALVGEAGDSARLELERGDDRAEDLPRVVQVDDDYLPIGGRRDEKLALHVDRVDALRELERGARCGALAIPVLDRLIPRGRDQKILLLAPEGLANRLIVSAHLHLLLRREVPHLLGGWVGRVGVWVGEFGVGMGGGGGEYQRGGGGQ